MNNLERFFSILIMLFALSGGIAGMWSGCQRYKESEFIRPITLRTAMVKSFNEQIKTANERGDKSEVLRIQMQKEKYEENWRFKNMLSYLTGDITNLNTVILNTTKIEKIKEILNVMEGSKIDEIDHLLFGSAYLATSDYKKASESFFKITDVRSANVYALRGLAVKGESLKHYLDSKEKEKLYNEAECLFDKAIHKGIDSKKLKSLFEELEKKEQFVIK